MANNTTLTRLDKATSFCKEHRIEPLSILIIQDRPISVRFSSPSEFKRVAGNAKVTEKLIDGCSCLRATVAGVELLIAKGQSDNTDDIQLRQALGDLITVCDRIVLAFFSKAKRSKETERNDIAQAFGDQRECHSYVRKVLTSVESSDLAEMLAKLLATSVAANEAFYVQGTKKALASALTQQEPILIQAKQYIDNFNEGQSDE